MQPPIAIPHWRAPPPNARNYALNAAGTEYAIVEEPKPPAGAAGLVLTGDVDVNPKLDGGNRGLDDLLLVLATNR